MRASELLGLRHGDLDAGRCTITVTSKGTRARDTVPAAVDSNVWLALYMAEQPPITPGGPVWWTRRPATTPLTYHAMRAVLRRANARLGTNWRYCTTFVIPQHTGCSLTPRSPWSTCKPSPASRQYHHHAGRLHPAAVRGPGREDARALRPTIRAGTADNRAQLPGRIGPRTPGIATDVTTRPSREQANATRRAAGPSIRLLSRPGSCILSPLHLTTGSGPGDGLGSCPGTTAHQNPGTAVRCARRWASAIVCRRAVPGHRRHASSREPQPAPETPSAAHEHCWRCWATSPVTRGNNAGSQPVSTPHPAHGRITRGW